MMDYFKPGTHEPSDTFHQSVKAAIDDLNRRVSALEPNTTNDNRMLTELQGIIDWGEKFGGDMIPGYIKARITHIKREIKEKSGVR